MAELIPIAYRVRAAKRRHLSKWIGGSCISVLLAASVLAYTFAWYHQKRAENEKLQSEFRAKSALITRSQELRSKRQDLAHRMQKIQELMDDKVLLSLLKNVSDGFSGNDCLEYINIDARAQDPNSSDKSDSNSRYVVRISGITQNSGTLAELMTRLGKSANPPVNVVLESSHREVLLDGQVMRFQIICEKADSHGT